MSLELLPKYKKKHITKAVQFDTKVANDEDKNDSVQNVDILLFLLLDWGVSRRTRPYGKLSYNLLFLSMNNEHSSIKRPIS